MTLRVAQCILRRQDGEQAAGEQGASKHDAAQPARLRAAGQHPRRVSRQTGAQERRRHMGRPTQQRGCISQVGSLLSHILECCPFL